ncbi:hypothetical protein X275_01345 [Marinitoga sp. 1197]|uniref:hypothetical protein n=1 Tax=Marinitoga sp. 1197 TaxID=1428449 RepID=UPI000640DA6D|nr:hypothetical protein [Marinitoga sp. 1197]AJW76916.1 hypothetical protein UF08_27 [Marinitoga camini virus 1]KLO24061.1 hypothetical protein X275_01345 [Marinitoga sp. 1197]
MYNDLLNSIKLSLESMVYNNKNIFQKVGIGALKADDYLSSASIFLDSSNHQQMTSFRYEINVNVDIVCAFSMSRGENPELFFQEKYDIVEVLEKHFKENYQLMNTEFSSDEEHLFVMFRIKTSEVR